MLEHASEDGRGARLDVDLVGIEVPQEPAKLAGNRGRAAILAC